MLLISKRTFIKSINQRGIVYPYELNLYEEYGITYEKKIIKFYKLFIDNEEEDEELSSEDKERFINKLRKKFGLWECEENEYLMKDDMICVLYIRTRGFYYDTYVENRDPRTNLVKVLCKSEDYEQIQIKKKIKIYSLIEQASDGNFAHIFLYNKWKN